MALSLHGAKNRIVLVVLVIFALSCSQILTKTEPGHRTVKRSVDVDTLVLENGERVRLIGVETLETKYSRRVEYFGSEASAFTKRMVEGKQVRLEFDPANLHRAHKDTSPERRTFAYVFLADGTLLNAEIIRRGYGVVLTRYPFARMEEFRRLEQDARENMRGMWGEY